MWDNSVWKWKYIMRFEIRYFFLEIEGLNRISRKKYLISSLIIYFCFPRACMLQYIVRAPLYSAWNSMLECVQQYIRVCATVLNISSCWSILIDVDPFWGGVPCGDFNRKIPSSARIGVFKARRKGGPKRLFLLICFEDWSNLVPINGKFVTTMLPLTYR